MAAVPFIAHGRRTPTPASCEQGCFSGRGEVSSSRYKGRRSWRPVRIFSGWFIPFVFSADDERRRRRRRDALSAVRGDKSLKDLFNCSICNFCCHCEGFREGRLRAQNLGFQRRVQTLGSKIRGGSSKSPLSMAAREQAVQLMFGRQAIADRKGKGFRNFTLYAALDPYELLGVSSSATEKDIKQAYRKLALKLHPDVNKAPDAQQQFLRVKNAYQTLSDEKSRAKYDASSRSSPSWDPFWESERRSARKEEDEKEEEEEFYGFESPSWDPFRWESESKSAQQIQEDKDFFNDIGEFFKDITVSIEEFFRDLKADSRRQASKPKSLWEELADIGEEFVEFLEKELNINDTTAEQESPPYEGRNDNTRSNNRNAKEKFNGPSVSRNQEAEKANFENEIADIEDMLAQLKKELGI